MNAGLNFTLGCCEDLQLILICIPLITSVASILTVDDDWNPTNGEGEKWLNCYMWEPLMRALLRAPQALSKLCIEFSIDTQLADKDPTRTALPFFSEINWGLLESAVACHPDLTTLELRLPAFLPELDAAQNVIRQRLGRKSTSIARIVLDPDLCEWA